MLPKFEEHDYWGVLLDTQDAIGTPIFHVTRQGKLIHWADGRWCC